MHMGEKNPMPIKVGGSTQSPGPQIIRQQNNTAIALRNSIVEPPQPPNDNSFLQNDYALPLLLGGAALVLLMIGK